MVEQQVSSARRVRRTLQPLIVRSVAATDADRYRKHFTAAAHIWMLLLGVLHGCPSLRQIHSRLEADTGLRSRLGLRVWASYSQLARSSSSRPARCFELLLADIAARTRRTHREARLLDKVQALDSSFIALSARLSPWSRHGGYKPGVRLQCLLDVACHIPEGLCLTLADTNDHSSLWGMELGGLRGWTVLFDLGYYGHRQLERLLGAGVSFVTRLNAQARYEVIGSRPVPEGGKGDRVLSDQTIRLGSPNNRCGAVLEQIRLVTSRNAEGKLHHFITDRFDLTALEVVTLYRKRWQIELFFRWLKRALGAIKPLGHSPQAVWLTVIIAAIVSLLVQLVEPLRPPGKSRVCHMRSLAVRLQAQLSG